MESFSSGQSLLSEQLKPTYGEISPSDTGIKFIARGKLPGDGKKRSKLGPDETGGSKLTIS